MKKCPSCQATYPTNYTHCPRDGRPLAEAGEWSEGTVVRGKYRILAQVGQGGMAAVYKALHVHFEELCALKVMSPQLAADPLFVRRFKQEAVITRKLQHPNAVRVEDIDEAEDGRPFMVMEYIEGRSLKEVIQQEAPMPVARVCSIAKQVAAALDAAHRLGMVHRDIKPANIVLVDHPNHSITQSLNHPITKVLDFGIAKIKEAHVEDSKVRHTTLTGTGMVIGTPAYMSPEQALGKKGDDLDGRSDIYSLGVVMYQMLAGELPFKADSEMGLVIAHIQTAPPDIRTRRPDMPEPIATLVMRCLQKKPEQRPANAAALIDEVEYWEQELARLEAARKKVDEERLASERAEAQRQADVKAEQGRRERERAEAEKFAREKAEAMARIKAEREVRPPEKSGADRIPSGAADRSPGRQPGPARPREGEAIPPGTAAGLEVAAPGWRLTPARGLWVGAAVLLVALGTVWHFSGPAPVRDFPVTPAPAAQTNMPASTGGTSVPEKPAFTSPSLASRNGAHPRRTTLLPEGVDPQSPIPVTTHAAAPPEQRTSKEPPAPSAVESQVDRTQIDQQIKPLITEADVDLADGVYDDAISLYEEALKIDPNNREVGGKLARAKKAKATGESVR